VLDDSDYRDELIGDIFEQWLKYRSTEEWLIQQIVKSRGTSRSSLKRHLKETRKMIKKIENQLFRI
jgi:predicted DNA-binding protein YlxM (UPF0122 family)